MMVVMLINALVLSAALMAQSVSEKSTGPNSPKIANAADVTMPAKTAGAHTPAKTESITDAQRAAFWKADREFLAKQLETARAKIAQLEAQVQAYAAAKEGADRDARATDIQKVCGDRGTIIDATGQITCGEAKPEAKK